MRWIMAVQLLLAQCTAHMRKATSMLMLVWLHVVT